MKRKLLLVLAGVGLVACSGQKAPQAPAVSAAKSSSAPQVPDYVAAPPIERGISARDRGTIELELFFLQQGCSNRMSTAELLAHGVKRAGDLRLSESQLVSDTNNAFAKSAAIYSVWIQKLQPYPDVVAALKSVRAAQYGCALDTVLKIEKGFLDFDTARADYDRAFDKAARELHAELDAVPVADDKHGLDLPDGVSGANQRAPTPAPAASR